MYADYHIELFWAKVDIRGPDECWEWTASIMHDGYGAFGTQVNGDRTHWRAHRFAWTITFGKIPDGLYVCHHCDNPKCVNPRHLFVGTAADNLRDASQKGRMPGLPSGRYEPFRCTKLVDEDVEEILELLAAGELTQAEIGARFGVHQTHISRIKRNEQWKWVERKGES